MVDEALVEDVAVWATRWLIRVASMLGLKRIRDAVIIGTTRWVYREVRSALGRREIDDEMAQHVAEIFNRIIRRVRDFELTASEAERSAEELVRLWTIYRTYRRKKRPATRQRFLETAERFLEVFEG